MGRPEADLDPGLGPVQRFAFELRKLRQEAGGITYRQMARQVEVSVSTLSRAAAGEQLPSLPVALAYVRACGGDEQAWERRWREAVTEQARAADLVADETVPSPYRGLARFDVADAELFFGRDEMTDALVHAVTAHRVFAVFGPSGSGKSSLLRAGLIPRLRSLEGPHRPAAVRILTPGERPHRTHDRACVPAPSEGDTWLVVDQFEEVFTLCHDPGERAGFLARLLAAAEPTSRLRVVLGVRADFYGRCAEHRELADALREANLLVGPMSPAELREAVVRPAQAAGLIVERELTARLVEETGGEPGGLPLLSHALRETWRRRRGRALTMEAYEAAGGVHGAIAQTAEEVYTRLSADHAELARLILLRLIAPGEGSQDTRRPVDRSELDLGTAAQDDIALVLDRLAHARLLTLDDDTVDLAHEALITAWPRLSGWIEEDRERLRAHRRLTEAARAWEELGRDPGSLYRGSRLATAEGHFSGAERGLNALEHDFLTAGLTTRNQEEHAAARTARRLRRLSAALAVLLVLAVTAGTIAWQQYSSTEQQRQNAVTARQLALSRQLAAQSTALITSEPDAASLLAAHAYRASPSAEATASLFAAASLPLKSRLGGHTGWVTSVAFSPDGRTVATGSMDHTARLWDIAKGKTRVSLDHSNGLRSVAFSPDGQTLATGSVDETTRLWDVRSGKLRTTLASRNDVVSVAFSPEGKILATGEVDGVVRLWDAVTGKARGTYSGHSDAVTSVAFSPDGQTLATSSDDATTRLWDTITGRSRILPDPLDSVTSVAFSKDGRTLAGVATNRVRLWDVATGKPKRTLTGDFGDLTSVAFSPDGRSLAVGSEQGAAQLLDSATGATRTTLTGHTHAVDAVAFSPDGRTLATASRDKTARLWKVETVAPQTVLKGHTDVVTALAFSPDRRILIAADREEVRLWDVDTEKTRRTFNSGNIKRAIALSRDGRTLAVSTPEDVRLWNLASGRSRVNFLPTANASAVAFSDDFTTLAVGGVDGHISLRYVTSDAPLPGTFRYASGITALALSPDGRSLAVGSEDDTVRLQDLTTKETRITLTGHMNGVHSLAFSPDGNTLASGGTDGTVRLWDVATGTIRTSLTFTEGIKALAFSPDGRTLATSSEDTTVELRKLVLPSPAQAISDLCRAVHRNLTRQEHMRFKLDHSSRDVCRF
ncbi:helix-turn-helix domain-containing protein [Streptomyces sp. GESEQ-4]|uniref:nSTAND1 domain-containing NTPase n=1 Tax=Streptomyces sp. GESEQ-4 TaxID=2812655 RepID=UPI001B34547B|nr:helix-turn-helix domain-containing protein [Streptomyces sp. GESEQ-4]